MTDGNEILSKAKEIHEELKGQPIEAHHALLATLQVLLQHRATIEQHKAQEKHQRDMLAAQLSMPGPQRIV